MNAASVQSFAARLQETSEAMFPATLTINNLEFQATRGSWRNVGVRDEQTQSTFEVRTVSVRVRKALLNAQGISLKPETTTIKVDGIPTILRLISGGASDVAWRLSCDAIAPAGAQA